MQKKNYWLTTLLLLPCLLHAQPDNRAFGDSTLRIDYELAGTNTATSVFMKQIKKEGLYAGSKSNLIDTRNYGTFRYRLTDAVSGLLLFSKGFAPLFDEWQTTTQAATVPAGFYQTAILPFPRREVRFAIDQRDDSGTFREVFSVNVKPDDYFIIDEQPSDFEIVNILDNGSPSQKVDIVFLAEGYRHDEMDKFIADVHRMAGYLFAAEPFASRKNDFNISAVKTPSQESGTDIPGEHIYRNTAFSTTFYTFDEPRYLTTTDMKTIHDAAASTPYDFIYILVNTERYGGGGFYNFLTVSSVDNPLSKQVLVHEFGHAFAGLADEYYDASTGYDDEMYRLDVEPWEPNITTMTNFDAKWRSMLARKTPVPTPRTEKYRNTLGVFEGGGYRDKGVFSPMMDCRMRSNIAPGFCPVCIKAINDAIDLFTK
ncbi:MAG: IgA Peptidase M64 [Bacteroidales bacterium]|jgi:hypothetical protein|nr:IgA Peptidase M64 [Bacteroidales bacterium]